MKSKKPAGSTKAVSTSKNTGDAKKVSGRAQKVSGRPKTTAGGAQRASGRPPKVSGRTNTAGEIALKDSGFDPLLYRERSFERPAPKKVVWPEPERRGRLYENLDGALEVIRGRLLVSGGFAPELAPSLPDDYSVLDVAWHAYDVLTAGSKGEEPEDSAAESLEALSTELKALRKVVNLRTAVGDPARKKMRFGVALTARRDLAGPLGDGLLAGARALQETKRFPALNDKSIGKAQRALDAAKTAVAAAVKREDAAKSGRVYDADPKQYAFDVLSEQLDLLRGAAVTELREGFPKAAEYLEAVIERGTKGGKEEEDEGEGEEGEKGEK